VAVVVVAVGLTLFAKQARVNFAGPVWLSGPLGWAPSACFATALPALLDLLPPVARLALARRWRLFVGGELGALAYEFSQLIDHTQRFAWSDVAATVGGALLGLSLARWLETRERRLSRTSLAAG
jgi:hypothetical protein